LTFLKEAEDVPAYAIQELVNPSVAPLAGVFSAGITLQVPRGINARARSSRR